MLAMISSAIRCGGRGGRSHEAMQEVPALESAQRVLRAPEHEGRQGGHLHGLSPAVRAESLQPKAPDVAGGSQALPALQTSPEVRGVRRERGARGWATGLLQAVLARVPKVLAQAAGSRIHRDREDQASAA